ncbi:putative nucleotidyltransferase, Ribonuclease H [Lupinus albus]|uniref:Putative nucleotidyltransferase, Ribonuclease H n=1 Tax=Lupinus albus TaxID=3870 RepID=A0A6A4QDS2_LUPAL|nr:putative nucleotidyltransferase, Ribonuclease H [Lupinus albus]
MDFIEGLPPSFGKQVIFVVVDRLSKAAHFMALAHPYTATSVAQSFLDNVFKLHGYPDSIMSDRDPIFISKFWQDLFAFQGVQLQLSSSYHPQTDGQSEVVNKCLETYLRCMCSDTPLQWVKWLPLAEWWYNTTFHTSIQATPYEIVYGQPPPAYLPYLLGESKVELVDRSLVKRDEMLKLLKFHLRRAQDRMKQIADKYRTYRQFLVGDLVYVKLHPYRQVSVANRCNAKLAPKYFGPYPVVSKVGMVAYSLQLPPHAKIHNVFHVSQLKKCVGPVVISAQLPSLVEGVLADKEPETILDRMMVKRRGQAITKVLVKWKHQLPEDATWEFYFDLLKQFPTFNP